MSSMRRHNDVKRDGVRVINSIWIPKGVDLNEINRSQSVDVSYSLRDASFIESPKYELGLL